MLFPVGEFEDVRDWGDPDCAPPSIEQFAPHGIDLDVRPDGALQLLVINHGGRESVEFLRVEQSEEGLGLRWRGCVVAPEHAFFNDLVTRRAGGFWATDMMPKNHQLWSLVTGGLFGADTGKVYRWTPTRASSSNPAARCRFPTGSKRGRTKTSLYVASFFGNDVRRLDLKRGEVTAAAKVERPDNITWSPDGKLLVASNTDSFVELSRCREVPEGACGAAFEVVSLDPQTMAQFVVLAHRGAPMGGVSVALRVADGVFLGSAPATGSRAGTLSARRRRDFGCVCCGLVQRVADAAPQPLLRERQQRRRRRRETSRSR